MYHLPLNTQALILGKARGEHQASEELMALVRPGQISRQSVDSFVDLIVFTRPGECLFAYDFGFSFWNEMHENVSFSQFNSTEYPRKRYTDQLQKAISKYENRLEEVQVEMLLSESEFSLMGTVVKTLVTIHVKAILAGTRKETYRRTIVFSIGPALRKH